MAVELLTLPAASALITKRAWEVVLEPSSKIHDHAKGIDQCQNGGDFQSEANRVLKHLLLHLKSKTQGKHAVARPANTLDGVDMGSSRSNDESEGADIILVPIKTCGEGDGVHKCPYFPCPDCHRSRKIFIPDSTLDARSQSHRCDSDRRTLKSGGGDEVRDLEAPLLIQFGSNVVDMEGVCTDKSVPVVTFSVVPDGGHKCPYFPCPYCHRTRSIFISQPDYNIDSPNVDSKVDCITFMAAKKPWFHMLMGNVISRAELRIKAV